MSRRVAALVQAVGTALAVLLVGLGVLWVVDLSTEKDRAVEGISPAAPVRMMIPGLRVDAPVVPIRVDADAVLDPPRDPVQVGWWSASAKPGAAHGRTVITGHTVHTGGGALDDVRTLRPGRTVDLVTGTGTMRYRVDEVEVLGHAELASRSEALFGQGGGDGRLVIVSCTDWDGAEYRRNVVVTARPVGKAPRADQTARAAG